METGQPPPDFTLTDIAGKTRKPSYDKGKTGVLEWVDPDFLLPETLRHWKFPELQKATTSEGVLWLSINSGRAGAHDDHDPAAAAPWLKQKAPSPTAYFRDQNGAVGRLYEAKATTRLYVIISTGSLVYDGAIDSLRCADVSDTTNATNEVSAALPSVECNQSVRPPTSQPYVCR